MQKKPFFMVMALVLLLPACGLKGPLYQTPKQPPAQDVKPDAADSEQPATKKQPS